MQPQLSETDHNSMPLSKTVMGLFHTLQGHANEKEYTFLVS